MADVFTNDLRIREQEVGANSGSWGSLLNSSLENIAEAFSYGTEALADSAAQTLTLADGASDELRSFYVKLTGTLSQATTVTLAPNTISKVWMIENATTGGYAVTISQGSGADVTVGNGNVKMIATDGAGSGGVVYDLLTDLELAGTLQVTKASSGATPTAGTVVTIEDDDNTELSLLGGSSSVLAINFGHSGDADDGIITYNTTSGSEAMGFTVNASNRMTIDKDGKVGIGNTTPGNSHANANLLVVGSGSAGGIGLWNGANDGGYYFSRDNANNTDAYDGGMSYDSSRNLKFHTNAGATRMTIDGSGHITMPSQPAFSARVGATQSNLAVGQNVDIVFGTEVYDVGSNFASSTFTAPVAGKYQLSYFVRLDAIDTAASYYYLMIKTSNRTYYPIYAGSTFGASDPTYMTLTFSVLADMDASDTAKIVYDQTGGTSQVDVSDGVFTGVLVC